MKKKELRNIVILLFMGVFILTTGCSDDDDDPPIKSTYLKSFKYTPNTADIKEKTIFASKVAIVTPLKAKVKFVIKGIKKGSSTFTNPSKGIKIDANTGKLSLAKDNTLDKAIYQVTVEGTDQTKKTIKKAAIFKITIK